MTKKKARTTTSPRPRTAKPKSAPRKPTPEPIDTSSDRTLSAIDAAAKVLHESDCPLTAREMIAAMSAKGYWTTPAGKTPHATVYSAVLREIATKGEHSRFIKVERGKFAAKR